MTIGELYKSVGAFCDRFSIVAPDYRSTYGEMNREKFLNKYLGTDVWNSGFQEYHVIVNKGWVLQIIL